MLSGSYDTQNKERHPLQPYSRMPHAGGAPSGKCLLIGAVTLEAWRRLTWLCGLAERLQPCGGAILE